MKLKAQNLTELSLNELNAELATQQQQRFDLQLQMKTKGFTNNQLVKIARRNIARLKTIIHEKMNQASTN